MAKFFRTSKPYWGSLGDSEEHKSLTGGYENESENETGDAANVFTQNRSLQRTNSCLKVIVGVLGLCITLLLVFQGQDGYKRFKGSSSGLIPSPVPPISTTKLTFREDPIYAQRPNPESDSAWNALLPPGRGFVFIPSPEDYNLPPGQSTPYGPIYSTALFHQLHCLGQLRRFTWMFLDTIISGEESASETIVQMFVEGDASEHLHHCFDYLRQGLMCNGDMSMEWPRTEEDGRRFVVDGWDIPHECKSWDQIMEYMDENHFNMSTNAEIAPLGGSSGKL